MQWLNATSVGEIACFNRINQLYQKKKQEKKEEMEDLTLDCHTCPDLFLFN